MKTVEQHMSWLVAVGYNDMASIHQEAITDILADLAEAKQSAPTWSPDPPTVQGFYFAKSAAGKYLVRIYDDGNGLRVQYHGTDFEDEISKWLGGLVWLGPLTVPE